MAVRPKQNRPPVLANKEVSYQPAGEISPWRVLAFGDLVGELGIDDFSDASRCMETVHRILVGRPRAWMIARRLYGIIPVLVSAQTAADDTRRWSRSELQRELGLNPAQFRSEIEAIADVLKRELSEVADLKGAQEAAEESADTDMFIGHQATMDLSDKNLAEYGFPASIHEVPGSTSESRTAERTRLFSRAKEWEKMLVDPMAGELARMALLNEMLIRRADTKLMSMDPLSDEFPRLRGYRAELEQRYKDQLLELDKVFPWRGIAGGKVSFRASVAELIKAVRDVRANNDHRLIDGINAAAEIEILFRQSTQLPKPRYRLGQVSYLLHAIEGLMDPNWRPQFSDGMAKKLDIIGQRLIDQARDAIGEHLPDLMQEGPGSEYPDLPVPPEPANA
ncbi:MAG: hypothetical protein IT581_06435 [Verrucomicrobiales bacterium]|nr:hypothetical protein [Verrucomicrobiales bacterium]